MIKQNRLVETQESDSTEEQEMKMEYLQLSSPEKTIFFGYVVGLLLPEYIAVVINTHIVWFRVTEIIRMDKLVFEDK